MRYVMGFTPIINEMDICFQYMLMRIDLVSATQSTSLFDYGRRIYLKFKDF